MYRHKPRAVVSIWIVECAILAAGAALLWGFLTAFGR